MGESGGNLFVDPKIHRNSGKGLSDIFTEETGFNIEADVGGKV